MIYITNTHLILPKLTGLRTYVCHACVSKVFLNQHWPRSIFINVRSSKNWVQEKLPIYFDIPTDPFTIWASKSVARRSWSTKNFTALLIESLKDCERVSRDAEIALIIADYPLGFSGDWLFLCRLNRHALAGYSPIILRVLCKTAYSSSMIVLESWANKGRY